MFVYRVLHATARRSSGILRVIPEDDLPNNSFCLAVEGEPDKKLQIQAGRPIFNEDGSLSVEKILIVESPDFDLTTLIGKRLTDNA